MLNEFYKYIANTTISFFQSHAATIRPGERYRLQLDTAEMVYGTYEALRFQTELGKIQGEYQYGNVYNTFTIRLSELMEIVVAAKIDGMSDDFLTTLRNENLTEKHFRFLYKGIIIKHNKTEPTYTKTSLFLCEKRRFFMARTEKGVVTTI